MATLKGSNKYRVSFLVRGVKSMLKTQPLSKVEADQIVQKIKLQDAQFIHRGFSALTNNKAHFENLLAYTVEPTTV